MAEELAYAVVGIRGRLLDARRTPLSIMDVIPERGEFAVRIEALKDRGAPWRLPLWEIGRLQFAADSVHASQDLAVRLAQAVER